jgi:hypothetical protein
MVDPHGLQPQPLLRQVSPSSWCTYNADHISMQSLFGQVNPSKINAYIANEEYALAEFQSLLLHVSSSSDLPGGRYALMTIQANLSTPSPTLENRK